MSKEYSRELYRIALKSIDVLDEYRKGGSFTTMESMFFVSVVIFNVFRNSKPALYDDVLVEYNVKIARPVEDLLGGTPYSVDLFIEERLMFYFHELKRLRNAELPWRTYAVFYSENFIDNLDYISPPNKLDDVRRFNKYLHKMFTLANELTLQLCKD